MTLLMRDRENWEIGEKHGEEKMAKLIMILNEDGRIADIVRVSQDDKYRQELYASTILSKKENVVGRACKTTLP